MVFLKIIGILFIAIVTMLMLAGLIIFIREIRRAPLYPDDFDPHSDDF